MALTLAASRPTVIINADAMQLVRDLRVITARPSEAEEGQAEHALYGVLDAAEPTSVACWLALVEPVIGRAWAEDKLPLLVGGTGMYVQALKTGLAAVPPIPERIRAPIRAMAGAELRQALEQADPAMAARLKPGDRQRNARALEVWQATGKSLGHWQAQAHAPLFPEADWREYYIDISKETLYPRLDARFLTMMAEGAEAEVAALLVRELPPGSPIMRAHGVPELAAYLRGQMPRDAAVTLAQQHTRNYAKRQQTWLRNQMADATALAPGDSGTLLETLR